MTLRSTRPCALGPALALALLATAACKQAPGMAGGRTLRFPLRADVGSLDPVRAATQYQGICVAQVFDTLVEFRYPRVPYELQPSLLARMPEPSADGMTWTFELRPGVRFHDDPCFVATGGKGREVVSDDVFYSIKRNCDAHWSPTGYWLFQGRIRGLDGYKDAQEASKAAALAAGRAFRFDYDAPVEGMRELDDRRFEIVLTEPFPQLLYVLTMTYACIVPREAVEAYELEFGQHPVGTGPFVFDEYWPGSWLSLRRNPDYREDLFPSDLPPEAIAEGWGESSGRQLPLVDRIVFEIFQQDQPMWLKFRAGDLDLVQVPAEYWPVMFDKEARLKESARAAGLKNRNLPLLDLIYWGFNMEDPIWGRAPNSRLLRQAISHAVDLDARNRAFYNNRNILYQGPIPPGLDGHAPGWRRRDVEKAKALLAEAGHPMGEGLPPLRYDTSRGSNNQEQSEMLSRQLADVGLVLETTLNSFSELDDKLKKKKAQFFGLAWGADYPDAENFLQLLYGPNEAPGSNNTNFRNAEYDEIFAKARVMMPSPERAAMYQRLREIAIEEQPMIGSMARTRFYLWHDRVRNVHPEEVYYSWLKYVDVPPGGEGR